MAKKEAKSTSTIKTTKPKSTTTKNTTSVKKITATTLSDEPKKLTKSEEQVKEKEKAMYAEQVAEAGKDQKIADQIIEGKWTKYKQEACLLEQNWVKDDSKKIKELITEAIGKLGENIVVRNFKRLSIR